LWKKVAGNELVFDFQGTIEEEVGGTLGLHLVLKPSMEGAQVPFVEVMVETT
jgi:hypothetical protein